MCLERFKEKVEIETKDDSSSTFVSLSRNAAMEIMLSLLCTSYIGGGSVLADPCPSCNHKALGNVRPTSIELIKLAKHQSWLLIHSNHGGGLGKQDWGWGVT